jgi:uncharacterized OB-fold protein
MIAVTIAVGQLLKSGQREPDQLRVGMPVRWLTGPVTGVGSAHR